MTQFTVYLEVVPPSINESRIPVRLKGRMQIILSEVYRNWRNGAVLQLKCQPKKINRLCYWRSDILIPRCQTSCDLDNHTKAIHDALHKAGVTPDDRYLVDSRQRFYGGRRVAITVKTEGTSIWQKIMKPSKSLIKRLEKS